jgi:Na+-transporting NADH:ubiquinone oxidoreductase subunit F
MASTILLTTVSIAAINGVLALLLMIAERFLANYGQVKISINEERELEVRGGSTLLSTLNSQKIFLPSACGGRGTCAYCKCKITEGAGPLLPTEAPLLNVAEIQNQIRIACQVKVKQAMKIFIPEALFNIREFEAEVSLIEDLTYDVKKVRLKLINPPQIRFRPGQYVQLNTQPYPGVKERVSRAYSIASPAAGELNQIDLIIRLVPEGICTTWVHQHLKTGDRLTFVGPMGEFGIHGNNEEMILIAGGSGMAPMVPILHELAGRQSDRKITYFFGANTLKDLFYVDEMRSLEKKLTHFQFMPVVVNPGSENPWEGATGLVTEPLESFLKSRNHSGTQGYLCGSPGMIHACIRLLNQYGIKDDQIFYDPFS